MKIEEFISFVTEMRHYQKEYFRTRNDESLSKAKQLESIVDRMIYEHNQPSLF